VYVILVVLGFWRARLLSMLRLKIAFKGKAQEGEE
jgi:hypothetical protein